MNERGFVTIFALCMILVIALVVKGIQESDTNHNYEAADLQTEFDLQNAADGGIYAAAEKVRDNPKFLPTNRNANSRQIIKIPVTISATTPRGRITVSVWGERTKIQGYTPNCASQTSRGYPVAEDGTAKYGYMLISVAQLDSDRMSGKIYRRAFAYVVDGYGTEYYWSADNLGHNGYKDVEPKPENLIDGTEGDAAIYDKVADKFFVVVKPADKDVVHFMELPSVDYYKPQK